MSFHSKGGSISRSTRTNRRDKESILGLSGWLFADLLLAIAVIFLVVQDKPSPKAEATEVTKENVAKLKGQVMELESTLAELEKSTPPTEKSGLIASAKEQLTITIPGGATAKSDSTFRERLLQSKLVIGTEPTSFAKLKAANYKIGFVIWFAKSGAASKSTSARHLGTFVVALNKWGLILDSQFAASKPGLFPHISDYEFRDLGDDLFLRVFLFKSTK